MIFLLIPHPSLNGALSQPDPCHVQFLLREDWKERERAVNRAAALAASYTYELGRVNAH